MTPYKLAALHARCFKYPAPWAAASFAAQLESTRSFLIEDPMERAFLLGRAVAGEGEILTLATAPEARRKGLARRLITLFEAEAKARGTAEVFLEVAEDNIGAQALYAGCGYVQKGRRPGYYVGESGQRIAAMILCKSLV